MQKIIPHLWFDKEAKQAAEFYARVFPHSKVTHAYTMHGTPSGDADVVSFDINDYSFMAISAGPYFKLNPSVSFMVNFDPSQDPDAVTHIKELWSKLSEGGKVLMEFQKYDFSELYGWVQDKFGVSWQLILTNPKGDPRPFIVPSIMFVKENNGKAEEATDFYLSVFKNSKRGILARYPGGPDEGKVMFTDFMLENQWFAAMDSGMQHEFQFNEAVSLLVTCDTQEEIDYYWEKLSAVPASEQCGWLKDKFGLSWQITPSNLETFMQNGTEEQKARVTQAFLKMKKFDIAKIEEAYKG